MLINLVLRAVRVVQTCFKGYVQQVWQNKLDDYLPFYFHLDPSRFNGSRAILSGPAGGVVGYAVTSYANGQPVIGFDMGGGFGLKWWIWIEIE